MSIEACVVRISDIIGYIGRDLDDAIGVNKVDKNLIPANVKNILGVIWKRQILIFSVSIVLRRDARMGIKEAIEKSHVFKSKTTCTLFDRRD